MGPGMLGMRTRLGMVSRMGGLSDGVDGDTC